jgi:hypothetical protein
MAVHVGETQHAKSLTLESSLASCILLPASGQVVNTAVDLYDEFGIQAHKVHDVGPDSSLPTKLGAVESPIPKSLP